MISVQEPYAAKHVVAAAEAAGASPATAEAVLAALPLGTAALEQVKGFTVGIGAAAGAAYQQSYVEGVK